MNSDEVLKVLVEMRNLLRVMAEPAIAERDKKLREALRQLVGDSGQKAKAVLLMDGSRAQAVIAKTSGIATSNLSILVKKLNAAGLLTGDAKQPELAISIPANFFSEGK